MSTTAVIFGGPAPEHDVSILTGLQAARALRRVVPAVDAIYWAKSGEFFSVAAGLEAQAFVDGVPAGAQPLRLVAAPGGGFVGAKGGILGRERVLDLGPVLVCCHGGPGEDGSLQAAFDLAGISYAGPTAAGAALGMDKLAFAGVVAAAGLPTLPRWPLVDDPEAAPPFEGPYLVKPRFGGSSIGIETVADFDTARARLRASVHLRGGAILEPYRAASIDLNVSIRSFPALELSPVEQPLRRTQGAEILGYTDKYLGGEGMVSAPRQLPAEIPAALEKQLRDVALRVAAVAGVRGVARVDFLCDGDELFVNEINTIPGSLSSYLWAAATPPVPFEQLLGDLLEEARQRPTTAWTTAGADGTVLRSAGSIASKLA